LLKGGSKVPKKDSGKEPGEVTQDEALTRRMAIKRIAAGLAGAGIVIVAGMIRPEQSLRSDELGREYGYAVKRPSSDAIPSQPPPPSGPRYGDAIKLPYGDKAPT
jgi:hypothetical protein